MSEILRDLNPEQLKAVECIEGPMLIVAGAGSGKTRVLTSRIAYLISQGVPPERILALTFTKKAAGEMKDRIARMVGERQARRIQMGTFHSVFIRFLREFADVIGFPATFTIYDTTDSVSAVKTCIKQRGFDDKVYKPKEVFSRISKAKNDLITPTPYAKGVGGYLQEDIIHKRPDLCQIYLDYCKLCYQSGVMDFDDILLYTNMLLRDHKDVLKDISDRFSFILVDEYQDTNMAQYLILKKLAADHHNLCVVGDDSQSIYGFRGAQIKNILNFQKDFPQAKLFRLERNYRSTQTIVNAANTLISKNEDRIPKNCVSMGEKGELIHLVKSYSADNEAERIAFSILERIREEGCQYQDFAVMYRTNAQSRLLEEKLRNRNIPYTIYGTSFYDRMEVKDVLAYFKLIVNPSDNESLKRIVNKPVRGIGETSLSVWEKASVEMQRSMFDSAFADNLEQYGLKNVAIQKIRLFCSMIKGYFERVQIAPAMDMARGILDDSGLFLYYKSDNSLEGKDRTSNVEEVLNDIATKEKNMITEWESGDSESDAPVFHLTEYLEDIALTSNIDNKDNKEKRINDIDLNVDNTVRLMTIHTAKGLEFSHVFVAGMEENIFPSGGWLMTPSDLEEERRLFYVAMTRAKKTLTLTYATERYRNGKTEFNSPSRFLREIAPQYLQNPLRREDFEASREEDEPRGFSWGSGGSPWRGKVDAFPYARKKADAPGKASTFQGSRPVMPSTDRTSKPPVIDANFVPDPMSSFRVGDAIEHNRFGAGKVLEISGNIPELKARILFEKYGEKLLLLKYAKIRHI